MFKILVVDEPWVARLLAASLPSNCQTLRARDGREAIVLAERDAPDLMLLDVCMPGLNGLEVLKWVKGSAKMAQTRVIVVTGSTDESYRAQALSLGADAFFTKPFSPRMLLDKITEFFGNRLMWLCEGAPARAEATLSSTYSVPSLLWSASS